MNEQKSIVRHIFEWFINNAGVIITSMISVSAGIVTLFGGIYKRIYWEEYYGYFNIDMRYVSVDYSWNAIDIAAAILVLFIFFFCLYMLYILINGRKIAYNNYTKLKNNKRTILTVVKFYRQKTAKGTMGALLLFFIIVYFVCCFSVVIYEPKYDEFGNPRLINEVMSSALSIFMIVFIGIFAVIIIIIGCHYFLKKDPSQKTSQIEKDYEKIFPRDNKNKNFKKQQIEIISRYYDDSYADAEKRDKRNWPIWIVIGILVPCLLLLGNNIQKGHSDAINQKVFLVTVDNKYVAIPVSEERYALIDIKEEGDNLTLLIGKQNFHESNDFPCIRKTYKEVRKELLK